MIITKEITDEEFEEYSFNKQKTYVSKLLINASKAEPVFDSSTPIAVVMAGLPGAGKTEFLDSLEEDVDRLSLSRFVRIDLDIIVTLFPGYTPKTYSKFRSKGNSVLARCIDVAIDGNYNMMIDGTFAGDSGASIRNVERLLNAGYLVRLFYMYDNPATAWTYTKDREIETSRGIDKLSFLNAAKRLPYNLQQANKLFRDNINFSVSIVVQKELRDKEYELVEDKERIDDIIKRGYNIDKLKEML